MRYCTEQDGAFCITIPDHNPIRTGTFNALLRLAAEHHGLSREDLLVRLFGWPGWAKPVLESARGLGRPR